MMMAFELSIFGWILCAITHYGMCFAYFQRKWPSLANKDYEEDILFSLGMSVFGPIALLVRIVFYTPWKYGFKFK